MQKLANMEYSVTTTTSETGMILGCSPIAWYYELKIMNVASPGVAIMTDFR